MFPKFDVSAEEIRDRIKVAIEAENLKNKANGGVCSLTAESQEYKE